MKKQIGASTGLFSLMFQPLTPGDHRRQIHKGYTGKGIITREEHEDPGHEVSLFYPVSRIF
jgi:hypothetical protein